MIKRLFDIFFSISGIIILFPILLVISLIVVFRSKGRVFFIQTRVGKNNRDFKLIKFRTMIPNASKEGLITTGDKDSRITPEGLFLRKYKLDELPQLFNILAGSMSFVGPRPEVRKYVNLYDQDQKKVLTVKPGLTDYASLEYINEGKLLEGQENPETIYIKEIMPAKLALNLRYIAERSLSTDIKIILKTIGKIFSKDQ